MCKEQKHDHGDDNGTVVLIGDSIGERPIPVPVEEDESAVTLRLGDSEVKVMVGLEKTASDKSDKDEVTTTKKKSDNTSDDLLMTPEAYAYWTAKREGAHAFRSYLTDLRVADYREAFGHPITLEEISLLVAFDGEVNSATCMFNGCGKKFTPVYRVEPFGELLDLLADGVALRDALNQTGAMKFGAFYPKDTTPDGLKIRAAFCGSPYFWNKTNDAVHVSYAHTGQIAKAHPLAGKNRPFWGRSQDDLDWMVAEDERIAREKAEQKLAAQKKAEEYRANREAAKLAAQKKEDDKRRQREQEKENLAATMDDFFGPAKKPIVEEPEPEVQIHDAKPVVGGGAAKNTAPKKAKKKASQPASA
ncbi:MAG: hypothetical protein HQ402_02865 [Parcubacteria group bacterium]|nr:hypothetical protein [Parcubacteria group bacterium]